MGSVRYTEGEMVRDWWELVCLAAAAGFAAAVGLGIAVMVLAAAIRVVQIMFGG